MLVKVSSGDYKGLKTVIIENDTVSVTIVPQLGAKIVSLKLKSANMEYAFQKTTPLNLEPYDGNYTQGEMCGFDDMFPTIDAGYYDRFPWKGIFMPDHGEVWPLAWTTDSSQDSAAFSIHGVRFPYRLSKKVLVEDNSVLVRYTAQNETLYDMDYLWSGHFMLAAETGSKFDIYDNDTEMITTYSKSGSIGNYGDCFQYPFVMLPDGSVYDASTLRDGSHQDFQKYYFKRALRTGRIALLRPNGRRIEVSFDPVKIPFAALLLSENGDFNVQCAFIEPCTAPFDSPLAARLRNLQSVLKADSTTEWYIKFTLS